MLSTSFFPNYIQFNDATIANHVVCYCCQRNVRCATVHDAFKSQYKDAKTLQNGIYSSYKTFYNADYLYKHFGQTPLIKKLNEYRINNNITPFYANEIAYTSLTKL